MNKGLYATCGTAFFLMFAYVVSSHGPSLVAWALLSGGVSQFVAQDESTLARYASIFMAYIAMFLCAFAAAGF